MPHRSSTNLTGKSIIYDPGADWGDAYISENQTEVATVSANDPDGDTITFSLITEGFPDSQWLSIDSTSGKVTFRQAPDFEDPQDQRSMNSYALNVKASDGTLEDTIFLTVFVQNVDERPIDNEAPLPLSLSFLSREVWVGQDEDFSIRELQPSLRVQDDVSGFASGSNPVECGWRGLCIGHILRRKPKLGKCQPWNFSCDAG